MNRPLNRVVLLKPSANTVFLFFLLSLSCFAAEDAQLFRHYRQSFSSDLIDTESGSFSFFIFSRVDCPRFLLTVHDGEETLEGFSIKVNGVDAGFYVACDKWLSFPVAVVRRGLNQLVLYPRYGRPTALDGRLRKSWTAQLRFQKATVFDPALMLRDLRRMVEAEEEVYYYLQRFDQYLRMLPRRCFPRMFLGDGSRLPGKLRRLALELADSPFSRMLSDAYFQAYGAPDRLFDFFRMAALRLRYGGWVWGSPQARPLAAYLYLSNSDGLFLHNYLADVVLAKRAVKTAYYEFGRIDAPLTVGRLDGMLACVDEECRRLRLLAGACDSVQAACEREADRVYTRFPHWRVKFRKAFCANVRARLWPRRQYPRRDDLFRERALLNDYFKFVKLYARQDLQVARVRRRLLQALTRFPRPSTVLPALNPAMADDGPVDYVPAGAAVRDGGFTSRRGRQPGGRATRLLPRGE